MAVFDGTVKVPRALADPKKDKDLSSPGALSWGGIKSAAGLAGANGADAKLIHGDRWQQIDGSHTENVSANLKTTIMANQTHTVMGNQDRTIAGNITHSVLGNVTTTITGAELRCNVGVQNLSHIAPKTRLHAGEEMTSESGAFMRWVAHQFSAHWFSNEVMIGLNILCAELFIISGWVMEIANMHTELKTLENEVKALHTETGLFKQHIKALKNHMIGMKLALAMAEAEVQTRVQAPPESLPGIE